MAIKELHEEKDYPIERLCKILSLNRSSYYKWLRRKKSAREIENEKIIHNLAFLYAKFNSVYGYRRLRDVLKEDYGIICSYGRIYRLTSLVGLK